MVTKLLSRRLKPVEKSLVEHVCRGDWLDLIPEIPKGRAIDEATMRSWDDSHTCRATVIRDILRGRLAADADPRGLRLRGARISGRLDLENLVRDVGFELSDCLLKEGILARDAHLTVVALPGCRIEHSAEIPLDGARLSCRLLLLNRASVIGRADTGAVNLSGANIGGSVYCDGASLRNESGPALVADSLRVSQDMFLRDGFTATGSGDTGAVNLSGANIGGSLYCDGASLRNESGPALVADSLRVGQGMFLRDGFTADGSGRAGAVRLFGARVGGELDCAGARLGNDSGPALAAGGLKVAEGMFLRDGFTATGSHHDGAVRLSGANIGGSLYCDGASLRNESGPALVADSLQVGQGMFLRHGFTAAGGDRFGAVHLSGANIGGHLDCTGATLSNHSGPALAADRLRVDQAMFLRGKFTATGSTGAGAVRLSGAHIGSTLDCTGATLSNHSGPALRADRLQVGQAIYLTNRFAATGGGKDVAVDLTGAQVGGTLVFAPAHLEHATDSHQRLAVARLTYARPPIPISVRGWLDLLRKATPSYAAQPYQQLAVDYRTLDLEHPDPEQLAHAADSHLLAVNGLTYAGVPETGPAWDWRKLLRDGTPRYAAQPYQQLASGYRTLGDERQARQTLIRQHDDQLARTHARWGQRLLGQLYKVTLGYGYQPWRVLLWLGAVVALSCVLAVALGSHGALAQTEKTAVPGRSCTIIQQVSVGLDLNLPFGTSLARGGCDLAKNSGTAAAWLTGAGVVLRVLAWAFAALFIAAFTGAIRKT